MNAVYPHGTNARYQRKCRCLSCRIAHYDYQVAYREGPRRHVLVGPTRRRINELRAAGLTMVEIARRAGLHDSNLSRIASGKRTRCHVETRDAVMGVAR